MSTQRTLEMHKPDLDDDVRAFITFSLAPSIGAQIKASDLYERFRQEHIFAENISDVKLAAAFGRHLVSKRVASGKVWLDYKIPYEYNWKGPDEKDVQKCLLLHTVSPSQRMFSMYQLGSCIRNLCIRSDHPLSKVSLIAGGQVGHVLYHGEPGEPTSESDNMTFHMAPNFWITYAMYHTIDIQVDFPFGTSVQTAATLTLTYDKCEVFPYTYEYRGTTTYKGIDLSYVVRSGMTGFIPSNEYHQRELCFKQVSSADIPLPTYLEVPRVSSDDTFNGLAVTTPDTTDIGALKLLVHYNMDYVTNIGKCFSDRFTYIRKDPDGYRCCVRLQLMRGGDLLDQIRLVGLPLPSSLINQNVLLKGPPSVELLPLTEALVLNMMALRYRGTHIELSTTFATESPPKTNLFAETTVVGRHYMLSALIRSKASHIKQYFKNISETFSALREALADVAQPSGDSAD